MKGLLEAKADANAQNWVGKTSLHLAQSPDIIEMLLQAGADIEIRDTSRYTALHSVACRPEREVLLKKLLEAGADRMAVDNNKRTALWLCAGQGDVRASKMLSDVGTNPDVKTVYGRQSWFRLHVVIGKKLSN